MTQHDPATQAPGKQRLDKWLWQARFFKTRSLATRQVQAGHVRVNSAKQHKPATSVGPGDVLTFVQGRAVRVVRITGIGTRRGPASEAQQLYDDLSEIKDDGPQNPRYEGQGRPEKRERRKLDLSRRRALE